MKLTGKFSLREIHGEKVIIIKDNEGLKLTYLSLNETSAFLWENLQDCEFVLEDIANLLVKQYGINFQIALRDSKIWMDKIKNCGLILN